MRDRDDGAAKIRQRILQHFAGIHVQMVGRLVQQQQVVFAKHERRQRNTAFFAAGKGMNGFKHVVARKQKHAQRAAHVGLLHLREAIPDLVQHGFIVMQCALMLIVVADIHI